MSRLEIETYPTFTSRVRNLETGSVFEFSNELYIKISGDNRAVNLATGSIRTFSSDTEVDDYIEGTIRIVRNLPL